MPIFTMINIMTAITTSTIKIPKPIPALNMSAMAWQELSVKTKRSNKDAVNSLYFFITFFNYFLFDVLFLAACADVKVTLLKKKIVIPSQ